MLPSATFLPTAVGVSGSSLWVFLPSYTLLVFIPFSDTAWSRVLDQSGHASVHSHPPDHSSRSVTLCARTSGTSAHPVLNPFQPPPLTVFVHHPLALLAMLHNFAFHLDTVLRASIPRYPNRSFEMGRSLPWVALLCSGMHHSRRYPGYEHREPVNHRQHFQYMVLWVAHPSLTQRVPGRHHRRRSARTRSWRRVR